MVTTWLQYGYNMVTILLQYCYNMVTIWLQYGYSCCYSSKPVLMRQVQQEGKEKVSTTNSSPVSLRATSLWSKYSWLHTVWTEVASLPCPHSSPAEVHVATLTSWIYSSAPSGWFTMNMNLPSLFLAALGLI